MDLRTVTFDVPPQEILTKDSVTVAVDAVVYFKVFNPMNSVINVANASQSTRLLASTTLRNILGTKALHVIKRKFGHRCLNQHFAIFRTFYQTEKRLPVPC